jgi:hypothetical protein
MDARLVGSLGIACALGLVAPPTESGEALAEALRQRFGAHAERALSQPSVISESASELVVTRSTNVVLHAPIDATGAVRIAVAHDEVVVHEVSLAGRVVRLANAIAYARDGGHSIWTTNDAGVEEWLAIEAGRAFAGRELARWTVPNRSLLAHGDDVLVAATDGTALLRVSAPHAFAASGRAVDVHLAVDGDAIVLDVDANGEAVLVDPSWVATTSLSVARASSGNIDIAVTLGDGSVLMAGDDAAERFDPTAMTWSAAGTFSTHRSAHTVTLLANGHVLVVGGQNPTGPALATAEVYDPTANTWSLVASMTTGRWGHSAALLHDGRVLVVGGEANGTPATVLQSAEVYDPTANTWSAVPMPSTPRFGATLTTLSDGSVLLAGGQANATVSDATMVVERIDAALGAWTTEGPLSTGHFFARATLLNDGRVLLVGGQNTAVAELYDPTAHAWTATAPAPAVRAGPVQLLLPGGRVLAAGDAMGGTPTSSAIWDPATGTWITGSMFVHPRFVTSGALLTDGRVVVIGGAWPGTGPLSTVEIWSGGANGATCTMPTDCNAGFCTAGVCGLPTDAGTANDASMAQDAGATGNDAGASAIDAGRSAVDAASDAAATPPAPRSQCGCAAPGSSSRDHVILACALGLALTLRVRRKRG